MFSSSSKATAGNGTLTSSSSESEREEVEMRKYHEISDRAMESLTEFLENLIEDEAVDDGDVEYSAGVLTLRMGSKGTYVINKQPPNKQIWLSSPISGPKRYDYSPTTGKWYYHRDQSTLDELLNRELSDMLGGKEVKIDLSEVVDG